MIESVQKIFTWSLEGLENSLLPQKGPLHKRVVCYVAQVFQSGFFLTATLLSAPCAFVGSRLFHSHRTEAPLIAFAKRPRFSKTLVARPPIDLGAATAEFQDEGPKIHPRTQFGELYHKDAQLLSTVGEPLDAWNHPEKVIDRLKELKFSHYRFSVSRDHIEPTLGEFDQNAIARYVAFCQKLTEAGITPMVTIEHFTHPTYFNWEDSNHIVGFVAYVEKIVEALYAVGVRKILTLNEPAVMAFQGYVMSAFPPKHLLDFEGGCHILKNMLDAHNRVYNALKEKYPDVEIGLTHNLIRFRNYHKLNPILAPLEKIICHYLTEMTHGAFFRCLQTGNFSLKVPFRANYQFSMEKPKLDFIGIQYYTDPLLNIPFGSVARQDQDLTSYGYRTYPQGLASAIEECSTLGVPMELTEIGIDIGINQDASDTKRIRYFNRIFQVIQKALNEGKNVRSLYFWTLIDNLEWHEGWTKRFGLYARTPEGVMTSRGVVEWLKAFKGEE